MSKYNRANFYKQETVNGVVEYDLVNNYWDLFRINRPLTYVTISRQFIQRPDLLSYALYGDSSYWWILSRFNNLDDWWNDVTVDMSISAPNKADIDDWFIQVYAAKTGTSL